MCINVHEIGDAFSPHNKTVCSSRSFNFTVLTFLSTLSLLERFSWRVHPKTIPPSCQKGAVLLMGFITLDVSLLLTKMLTYFLSLLQLFTASLSWAFQQQAVPPKYQYRDPVTSDLLLCDQCPPGTAVKQHCTADKPTDCHPCPERHFAENWHWGDTCQYCTSVCIWTKCLFFYFILSFFSSFRSYVCFRHVFLFCFSAKTRCNLLI